MQKIMFNETFGLESDTLSGTKERTSRIAMSLPENFVKPLGIIESGQYEGWMEYLYGEDAHGVIKPRYQIGEIVAIAQRYADVPITMFPDVWYMDALIRQSKGWNNKMFVMAKFMPHQIEITGIKLERLQDISDEDCMKEGICHAIVPVVDNETGEKGDFAYKVIRKTKGNVSVNYYIHTNPKEAFAALIDAVSGKGTWESNPWVWVYYYKLVG